MRQVLANESVGTGKTLLRAICILEAATGIALLIAPSVLGLLLFGQELSGPATLTARFAGIALLALAVACWPTSPLFAMFFYSAAATLFLGFVGIGGSSATAGVLLWPAMVCHLILAVVLIGLLAQSRRTDLP
jgi:hypothetical protein